MDNTGRRKFLGIFLGGLTTAAIGIILYPFYRYLSPAKSNTKEDIASFTINEVSIDRAKYFEYRGSTGVVIKTLKGELMAFSAVCTHLGCIVQWEKNRQAFLCPCHAGRYDSSGAVLSGPPPRPLVKLPLSVTSNMIVVGEDKQ